MIPFNNNLFFLMNMMRSGNPDVIYQNMMWNNPQFRQFVENSRGKSISEIARENGVDLDSLRPFIK